MPEAIEDEDDVGDISQKENIDSSNSYTDVTDEGQHKDEHKMFDFESFFRNLNCDINILWTIKQYC